MKKINVVLHNPEIPQNTGNIMRTCIAYDAKLHLIKPLGFSLDEKQIRRTGLDYIEHLEYEVYENYEDFMSKNSGRFFYTTRFANKTPKQVNFASIDENIYLVFGAETKGIPYDILANNMDDCYRIPMTAKVRSLNLSNTVAMMLYKVSEDMDYEGLETHEPETRRGKDFLLQFINKENENE